jgi:predicted GH43/DUF377 family glycosyl hydrolase
MKGGACPPLNPQEDGKEMVSMDRKTYIRRLSASRAGWLKYPGNPVLGGDLGTCFDISVLAEEGKYRMIFSWRPKKSIALVESTDGIHWTEPAILLSPRETPQHWEDVVNRPSVIRQAGKYHMWYTGQYPGKMPHAEDGRSWLFYAISADLFQWERVSLEPVLSAQESWEKAAVMCPNVLWDDSLGLYKMWYSGGEQYEPNAIGYATSADGLLWNKHPDNPIFSADPSHAWEQHKVTACQVLYQDGFWDEDTAQIGIARSEDGITAWERHPQNPVIAPSENEWDGDACYKPYTLFDGHVWHLWYNGRHGELEQIGMAIHEWEDLGFV